MTEIQTATFLPPEPTTAVPPRCVSTRSDGGPCRNPNIRMFGELWYCPFHMPIGLSWPKAHDNRPEEPKPEPDPLPNAGRLETVEDVRMLMQWAVQQLARGTITESQSRGVVNGAKSFLQVLKDDHEKRVKELEDKIGLKRYGTGNVPE